MEQQQRIADEAKAKWNFDFGADKPALESTSDYEFVSAREDEVRMRWQSTDYTPFRCQLCIDPEP